MPPERLQSRMVRLPFFAAVLALLLAPAMLPAAEGWETGTKWDGGVESFTIDSTQATGGNWSYNFSLPRNSEVRTATMRVEGRPYVMDPGWEFQTLHWPQNPSIDVLGDGVTDWAFPGTMGLQQDLAANTTGLDLRWESRGLTKYIDIPLPKSTVNEFSLAISNSQTSKFAYSMAIGDQPVWAEDSLSFSYNQTSLTKETLNHITTADINGDGREDLIGCGANGKIYISRSINGRFGNATVIDCQVASAQNDMLMVAAGDLDGNPGVDLAAACADGNIYVLLNQGGAGLFVFYNNTGFKIESSVASRMASVAIADIDGDGANDIVGGNLNGRFYVFFNEGGAQFDTSGGPGSASFKVVNAGSGQMNDVCVADINLDTFPDLVGANANKQFYVAYSFGGRDFDSAFPVVTGAIRDMVSVDAVDIDKDADFDLVGASLDGKMYICMNLGNAQGFNPGTFNTQPGSLLKITLESGTNSLRASVVSDVNGDDWQDIIALGSSNSGQVYVLINDGINGTYPDTNMYKLFSAGQSATGIAAAPLVRSGYVDLVAANGNRMDIWKSDQGPFDEVVGGPAFVQAVQAFVDNATAAPDGYGNPWVTLRLAIFNQYYGQLHFSNLFVNYTYNALVDFTSALSAHLNETAGPNEALVECPFVFKMDSAGTLVVSDLHIESSIGLVALIDFPEEDATLYKDRAYTLSGRSNYDPDGSLFNYTWTDQGSGRLLGYGSRIPYTPAALGNVTIQLRARNDIGGKEAISRVHASVVEEPKAVLDVMKATVRPSAPMVGETVTLSVTIQNTGKANATNVGFQVFLDHVGGLPVASGVVPSVNMARAAAVNVRWTAGAPGTHNIIVKITQADQAFTTPAQPYSNTLDIHDPSFTDGIPPMVIAYGTMIGVSAAVAAAFFLTTEIGKLMGLTLFLPLYSKLQPEDVLDRFIRGKILGYIRANPGAHYNLIKQDLDLHNGTLLHHLDTLERNGFIKSARDGTLKRFFPGNWKVPEGRLYMSPIQDSISRYIGANPDVSQADVSRGLYIEPHIVRYHVGVLREANVLRVEEEGNRTQLFLA